MSSSEEYLLAKNFEIVFESIIDDLIGDETIASLRELSDGKEIDHLYLDESLTWNSESKKKTFYIADSKYYKRGNSLGLESIAKQFTYARNLLQLDLDMFLNGDDASEKVKSRRNKLASVGLLRDQTTEGYDIIPNFFISATVPTDLGYDNDHLAPHSPGAREYRNIHFENRLFDRDTLILSHYDVNFLYIIKLYARNDTCSKLEWRDKVRIKFRSHIRELLMERFTFFAVMPDGEHSNEEAVQFLRNNFHPIHGKLFSPYPEVNGKKVFLLALEAPENIPADNSLSVVGFRNRKQRIARENEAVKQLLQSVFILKPCQLGENPAKVFQQIIGIPSA